MAAPHVLLWPFPGHGHVDPTLPVAAELVRRGLHVTVATTERFAEAVTATGAEVLPYASALAGRPLPEVFDPDYLAREPLRAMIEAIATVPPIRSHFQHRQPPDLVVYDSSTYAAARVAALTWSRPAIQMFPTFASNEKWQLGPWIKDEFAPEIDEHHPALLEFFYCMGELLSGYGLDDIDLERFHAPCEDHNLVFLPKFFQLGNEFFDDRHEFLGPCLPTNSGGTWQPPASGHPVLVVSLGTEKNKDTRFFHDCAQAFADLPWHVVLTLGGGMTVADLGPLPANVEAHQYLSHAEVLPHATALVAHAGMSTTMRALHHGVAQVLVPHTPEQHFVARRAAELGIARLLPRDQVTAHAVREAVLELTSDDRARTQIRELAEQTRAAGGAMRAADLIQARLA
ncbi:macrolide family glycosyltransferase [Kutzneria viridogrisea]|uniref:Erythromycin biosynthesis protein CIII-like C-terminal domain-containing protein n=2 Tax=Kutzneria TaxID=43356 RepID=W5W4Y5_9PSEU|nr:macrolide family glycosyltransferase [Kutzneria albida]AHH95830.1 hypothetical protein KALB_2462 [Kutzneria albida DSM 43870]